MTCQPCQHVIYSLLLLNNYDNVNATYKIAASEEEDWKQKTVSRAYNAHLNSWEAFNGFAAAVALALQANVDSKALTKLCNAFLVARSAYVVIYPLAYNLPLSIIRSGVFSVGITVVGRIFCLSFQATSPQK